MAAVHEHTIHTHCIPSQVQFATDGTYLAIPYGRTNVGVWSLQDITKKPLELVGHGKPVSALCFSPHRTSSTLLCSCAQDYIIVWNIEKCKTAVEIGQQVRGRIIGRTLGSINYCCFSVDTSLVAVCVEKEVFVLDAKVEEVRHNLEGHVGTVTCAEFCLNHSSVLITASDDRTFKIWNLETSTLVYQSCIISSSPFISLRMNPLHESFALGSADGQLRVYDLTDGNGFRCLNHIDLSRLLSKLHETEPSTKKVSLEKAGPTKISSRPLWQRPEATQVAPVADRGDDDVEAQVGCSILSMAYTYNHGGVKTPTPSHLPFLQDDSLINELLENAPMLAVVTTGAVLQLNARTFDPCSYTNLQEPLPSYSVLEEKPMTVSVVGSSVLAQSPDSPDLTWCILGSLFGDEVSVLRLGHPTYADHNQLRLRLASLRSPANTDMIHGSDKITVMARTVTGSGTALTDRESVSSNTDDLAGFQSENSEEITVLSSGPLMEKSPLKAELVLKTEGKSTKSTSKGRLGPVMPRRGSASLTDQPLVFNTKVKSSGYTATPRTTMFSPKLNSRKSSGSQPLPKCKSTPDVRLKEYPTAGEPPIKLSVKLDAAERPTAIGCVRFSGDGQQLLCSLANTTAQIFRMPLTGKGAALTGHDGVVTSAQWSRDNKWIITSSDDKTARIWSTSLPDPVMTLRTERDNFGAEKEGGLKLSKDNPSFTRPVKHGQFYYMDKFILLACGSSFHLYKFHLDMTKSDIKRYLSSNRYKVVSSWQLQQSHQITAFSAVNSFYSYLALCGGSNKAIEVFDLNVGKNVRIIPDVHTRAPHVICQNEGSSFVSHPPSTYDLFVTAAASDCVKLWDLRSNRCVRRYEGHVNRVHPCGVSISPCSRFIATGSEDRTAYIYDIRSGTYLHKLMGHTDTVGQVAFHPLYPQLLTASMDGKLRLFVT